MICDDGIKQAAVTVTSRAVRPTMPVTVSLVNVAALLALALAASTVAAAPRKPKNKELKNVIITSFGEMPYEPVEGFYQGDAIPVGPEGDEKNPTMDVVLRTGILVEDPNEKKSDEEENSAEDVVDKSGKDNRKKTGEELFREFREKHRYAPKKGQKSRSAENQWSPVLPSFADDFLQPKKKPSEPPTDNGGGYNVDREYQGDLGAGWNLQDAAEVLQNRNYNVLSQNPGYPSIPSREVPPPLQLTPGVQYPFAMPSLPYPDFNLQRRSRVFPFGYVPSFYGQPDFTRHPDEFKPIDRQDVPKKLEMGRIQLHPTRIGVPYNPPAVLYGSDYFRGI